MVKPTGVLIRGSFEIYLDLARKLMQSGERRSKRQIISTAQVFPFVKD
jgi:hypothetical protein